MLDLSLGASVYVCRKNLLGRTVVEKKYVIKNDGDWVSLGYDNHPHAFSHNGKIHNIDRSYFSTPGEAVEDMRERTHRRARDIGNKIVELKEKQEELRVYANNLHVDDCELVEQKYDPLDDLM